MPIWAGYAGKPIILTVTNCVAHTAIVKPLALKKGDTVAIVAPSFHFEKEQLYEAIERLRSFGLTKLTMKYEQDILFQNSKEPIFSNNIFNTDIKNDPSHEYPAFTINNGTVRGQFIGGNLSVLVSLLGTPYFPKDWSGTNL